MNNGIRELIIKTVKLYCLSNKNVSLVDDTENYIIRINQKSVEFEMTSHEFDYENFSENMNFEITITVWAEIKTDSLLTNQIRAIIKSLQIEVKKALAVKKESEAVEKRDARILRGINKDIQKRERNNPYFWEVLVMG